MSSGNITNNTIWIGRYHPTCGSEVTQGRGKLLQESIDRNLPSIIGELESAMESLCSLWLVTEPIQRQEDGLCILTG